MTNERPELPKSGVDWVRVYSQGNLGQIPWNSDKPDQELTELIESGKIRPRRALDVGCGTGTDAIYLATQGAEVMAIDISPEATRIAQEKGEGAGVKVHFIAGDFWKVEFDTAAFDFVNDRGFFHIINPMQREDFAAKVSTALTDTGLYFLRCWSDRQQFESELTPYRISRDSINRTFGRFFDVEEIRDFRWGGKGPWGYVCLMGKKGQAPSPTWTSQSQSSGI